VSAPPAYLDECVDQRLAGTLRSRGFSVLPATEAGTLGTSDPEQLRFARSQDLVIISYNRRHFRRLHAQAVRNGEEHPGIVILPATSPLPRLTIRAAMMLDWIGGLGEWRTRLFEWGDLQYLLTQGLRLEGYTEEELRLALGQRA
jgi:hypothetical protein